MKVYRKKVSRFLFLTLGFGALIACNGSKAEENIQPTENETIAEVTTEESPVNEENIQNSEQPNTEAKWQIDDYAAHLVGARIALDAAGMDHSKGINWYYQTLDLKGGFASITGPIEGWQEYVVWRMADGDDLVAEMAVGCGPACDYRFNFYKGQNSGVSKLELEDIFPVSEMEAHRKNMVPKILAKYPVEYPSDNQWVYNFPQKGTGMRVDLVLGADEVRVPILKLGWNKTTFYIEELIEKVEETYE